MINKFMINPEKAPKNFVSPNFKVSSFKYTNSDQLFN